MTKTSCFLVFALATVGYHKSYLHVWDIWSSSIRNGALTVFVAKSKNEEEHVDCRVAIILMMDNLRKDTYATILDATSIVDYTCDALNMARKPLRSLPKIEPVFYNNFRTYWPI